MGIVTRRGSFSIEYAFLITVVAAALVSMAVYLKRAVCGRWKQNVDSISFGRQYEPHVTVATGP